MKWNENENESESENEKKKVKVNGLKKNRKKKRQNKTKTKTKNKLEIWATGETSNIILLLSGFGNETSSLKPHSKKHQSAISVASTIAIG